MCVIGSSVRSTISTWPASAPASTAACMASALAWARAPRGLAGSCRRACPSPAGQSDGRADGVGDLCVGRPQAPRRPRAGRARPECPPPTSNQRHGLVAGFNLIDSVLDAGVDHVQGRVDGLLGEVSQKRLVSQLGLARTDRHVGRSQYGSAESKSQFAADDIPPSEGQPGKDRPPSRSDCPPPSRPTEHQACGSWCAPRPHSLQPSSRGGSHL